MLSALLRCLFFGWPLRSWYGLARFWSGLDTSPSVDAGGKPLPLFLHHRARRSLFLFLPLTLFSLSLFLAFLVIPNRKDLHQHDLSSSALNLFYVRLCLARIPVLHAPSAVALEIPSTHVRHSRSPIHLCFATLFIHLRTDRLQTWTSPIAGVKQHCRHISGAFLPISSE